MILRNYAQRLDIFADHVKLAKSLAYRYYRVHCYPSLDDLQQVALMGLWRATQTWDPALSSMSTYTTQWVISYLQRLSGQQWTGLIRVPEYLGVAHRRNNRHAAKHRSQYGEEPTPENEPTHYHHVAQTWTYEDIDGHYELAEDGGTAADDYQYRESRMKLMRLVARLPRRKRAVMVRRYGLDDRPAGTLDQAGAVIGVSRERARQIEQEAIALMRKWSEEDEHVCTKSGHP